MEATNIEEISKDTSKKKGKTSQRGRSKKKGSAKSKKEPFRHIGSHLVPSVAIVHASPTYVSKSRSPSPVARAIQFISRIGQAIPAGKRLQRSLSEQDVSRSLEVNKLIESKRLSQSNPGPGPSGLQELHHDDDDDESEAGYDRIDDVRRRAGILSNEADASPMAKRPPMPLPDEADIKETRRSKSIEDLYSKVIKHSAKETKVEQMQRQADPNYDSDDITSVSEMDEDTTSKVASSSLYARKMRAKSLEVSGEDMSDGPSEGEVYRLPFDALHGEKSSGALFETIEELDNEDLSIGSKRPGDGLKSPGSGHSKASLQDSSGYPVMKKTRSVSSLDSDQGKRSSRPHTPRDFGKEAALRRLEEIGFDAMCSEFGFQNSDSQHSDNERDFEAKQEQRVDYFAEEAPAIVDAGVNESTPSFRDEKQYYQSSLGSPEKEQGFIPAKRSKDSPLRNPRREIVIEEPQMKSTEALQQFSSHEMRIEELVDESFDDSRKTVSPKVALSDRKLQNSVVAENKSERGLQSARSDLTEHSDEASQKDIEKQMKTLKRDVARLMRITDEELRRQRDTQKHVFESQAMLEEDVVLRGRSPLSPSRSNVTEGSSRVNGKQSFEEQRRVQLDMTDRQDRILEMIEALESQVKKIANITSPEKDGIEEEEQLLTLRKLILEEQRKYNEQQKVLEEQQQRILEAQRHLKPKKTKRPQSRFSTSPVSPRKSDGNMVSRQGYVEQPDQFRILDNRLKTVEAERQALLDLNASLQDENDALKRLALHHDQGDSSGIIYKKQNKDLTENNKNLKTLVHRLNVELSRYQAKYRPPRKDEIEGLSLPEEGPIPQWLVNIKYLSPLIMAYDDRLKDKNEVIQAYETQLASFKTRMLDIVRENQRLHMVNSERHDDDDSINFHEWNLLQEQAKLVLEENSILMQEIDLKDRRIDEVQYEFQSEVTRLTKRLRILDNEKKNAHASLASLQMESELWKKKFEEVSEESKRKISQEEMERKIEDVNRSLSTNMEILQRDKDMSSQQYKAVFKEKQELAVKLTDATAKGTQLQLEIDFTTNALRKAEKKLAVMQSKVDNANEREMVATETLTQVLAVAERNERERDDLARMVQAQNNQNAFSYEQKKEDDIKLDLLKSHLQKYKKISKKKDAEVSIRMQEKDEEILNLKNSYNKEIASLRDACRQRQNMLDHIQSDKRQFEHEIDDLWKSVNDENEQFKKSITR